MLQIIELALLCVLFLVGGPLLITFLLVGPTRFRRGWKEFWDWLTNNRHEPADVIQTVVQQHQRQLEQMQGALAQAEKTQAELECNLRTCEKNRSALEQEAKLCLRRDDEEGAHAALLKQHLEEVAQQAFAQQHKINQTRLTRLRRRLHRLELQLRQFEVGRSILLSQLAEARTVQEQYALANHFDPFSAVAQWRQIEGEVKGETDQAKMVQEMLDDTAEMPLISGQPQLDARVVQLRLEELKASANAQSKRD